MPDAYTHVIGDCAQVPHGSTGFLFIHLLLASMSWPTGVVSVGSHVHLSFFPSVRQSPFLILAGRSPTYLRTSTFDLTRTQIHCIEIQSAHRLQSHAERADLRSSPKPLDANAILQSTSPLEITSLSGKQVVLEASPSPFVFPVCGIWGKS